MCLSKNKITKKKATKYVYQILNKEHQTRKLKNLAY